MEGKPTRIGKQSPTRSFVLPYEKTLGEEAVAAYEQSGRKADDWQRLLAYDLLALNADGLWTHAQYGIAVPRQNGKNETITIREVCGLLRGEKILHTAHRTDTAHTAWERLYNVLSTAGIIPSGEKDKGIYKAYGKEHIYLDQYLPGAGRIEFRTRTSKGGLGTSYDLLIIDEAQEYQDDQKAALQYTIAASSNPQTIYIGTPPTANSVGTIFQKMRQRVLAGEGFEAGWSEWSVPETTDPGDVDAWYEANPSLGLRLTERTIRQEIGGDAEDFLVQRLGCWLSYSQRSAISAKEWAVCHVDKLPTLRGKLFIGVKYSTHQNVALSIAVKTQDGRIFAEVIDCRPTRATNRWIMDFLRLADWREVIIDGQSGQKSLCDLMREARMRRPILPSVQEIIKANSEFEQAIFSGKLAHSSQPSVCAVVENCEHRPIGSGGGFGFRALHAEREIALMESMSLAVFAAMQSKEHVKQTIRY